MPEAGNDGYVFNDISGGIDRVFRFFEMLGITALIGVLASTSGQIVLSSVTLLGTTMAIMYLTEPTLNLLANHVLGGKRTKAGVILVILANFLWVILVYLATPSLTEIPLRIAKTISMAS
jgi:fucose permease